MVEVRYEYSSATTSFWYNVYKNGREQGSYYWKWCAVRAAKRIAKYGNSKSQTVFKIE